MSDKTSFSVEEWNTLTQLPHFIGLAVAGVSPSGISGVLSEAMTVTKTLISQKATTGLLGAIATDATSQDTAKSLMGQISGLAGKTKDHALAEIPKAIAALAKATPEEAKSYKDMLAAIAQHVAEAAKEGGFLGMGGEQVSQSEKTAVSEINTALGL